MDPCLIEEAALEEAIRYACDRQTFGRPIGQHQAIQHMIADMSTELEAARLLVYRAAWLKDQEKEFGKEAAMAKLFASETAERVAYKAIQIHGGYGYSAEFPVERIYRDQRLLTIGEHQRNFAHGHCPASVGKNNCCGIVNHTVINPLFLIIHNSHHHSQFTITQVGVRRIAWATRSCVGSRISSTIGTG
jgi:hypothetical protein